MSRILMLKERADAAAKSAREVAEKAAESSRDMTDDERSTYDQAMTTLKECLAGIQAAKADEAILEQAKAFGEQVGAPEHPDVKARVKSLGLTVVESPEFKSLLKSFPEGRIPEKSRVQSAPIPVKSLFTGTSRTSAGAFVVTERTDIYEGLGRRTLRIRDLVSNRRTGSDTVEYVRQTSHTNAAAVVAEATSSARPTAPGSAGALVNNAGGGYKPEGSWAYEVVKEPVKTIAEWVPLTKRAAADVAFLETLINDELAADVADTEEDQILNGNGTGENFRGINNVSGVQVQAFDTDMFTTARKALTKARIVGRVNPTAWVMNPADAERVDLAQDAEKRFYYGGPQAIGQRTLWGIPIVECEAQPEKKGILADWSKAVIWDREQTTVTMTDSHEDFFVRNLLAILAEERLAFGVIRPTAFVAATLAT